MAVLFDKLQSDPTVGTSLGGNIYKIRITISSKNKGKSGGARVIYFVKVIETTVLLFSIYDKSEKANLSNKEIEMLLRDSQS